MGLIGFDSKMKWNVSMPGHGDVSRKKDASNYSWRK